MVVEAAREGNVARGEVVLARGAEGFRVHRLIRKIAGSAAVTRGDAGQAEDAAEQEILGRVVAVVRRDEESSLERPWSRPLHAARTFLRRVWLGGRRKLTGGLFGIVPAMILWQLLAGAAPAQANTVPITVTQTPSVTTVSPGGQVTYTDVMVNTNNTASTHMPVFTQPIPTNTTYVSFVGPAGFNCTTGAVGGTTSVVCTDTTTFPANGTATLTVTVQVALGTAGQTVLNGNSTPTVTPALDYTVTTNITSTATVISADLSLTQSAAPASVGPGQSLTFTNTITNINDATGGSTAAAPVVTFATPLNTTFTSASGVGYTCSGLAAGATGTETCTATGPLAVSGTSTVTIVVAVNGGTANGTVIMGSAMVSSTTYDPSAANNTGTSTSTVTSADLSLTQSDAPTSVGPGNKITYTDVITNNGPATAAAPVLTFATPANTTFASASGTGYTCAGLAVGATGTETCTAAANLANAGTATITIAVTVAAGAPLGTVITGSATVTSTTFDPNLANNTASSTATVAGADLTMSQTTSVSVVDTGVNFTYTEIATNNGPATVPAGTLVIYQQTPPNTTLVSIAVDANWTCVKPAAGGTGPIICTYTPALAGGANTSADPIVFVLKVNAATAYGTTILNSATVTSQTIDPVPSNNTTYHHGACRVGDAGRFGALDDGRAYAGVSVFHADVHHSSAEPWSGKRSDGQGCGYHSFGDGISVGERSGGMDVYGIDPAADTDYGHLRAYGHAGGGRVRNHYDCGDFAIGSGSNLEHRDGQLDHDGSGVNQQQRDGHNRGAAARLRDARQRWRRWQFDRRGEHLLSRHRNAHGGHDAQHGYAGRGLRRGDAHWRGRSAAHHADARFAD